MVDTSKMYSIYWETASGNNQENYIMMKDIDFIDMADLQGVYDQLTAIALGWA